VKSLLLLRHGSAGHARGGDRGRTLTPNGRRQAAGIGRHLAATGLVPDHALVSSAARATETFDIAATAGGWSTTAARTDELYNAWPERALTLVSLLDDAASDGADPVGPLRVMLVGHQPTLGPLAEQLTREWVSLGTGTLAVVEFDIMAWADVLDAPGRLARVVRPRELPADLLADPEPARDEA
jgi:phosphohistidine phosphatase